MIRRVVQLLPPHDTENIEMLLENPLAEQGVNN
jgi:hypothetical protein